MLAPLLQMLLSQDVALNVKEPSVLVSLSGLKVSGGLGGQQTPASNPSQQLLEAGCKEDLGKADSDDLALSVLS